MFFFGGKIAVVSDVFKVMGSSFQTIVAATEKACLPKLSFVLGTISCEIDGLYCNLFGRCVQFEAIKVNAALKQFTVSLRDRRVTDSEGILRLHLNNLCADFKQRPSANAIRYTRYLTD